MTEAQIKHMTEQFLRWKLPADFHPDCGISFVADYNQNTPYPAKHQPVGTNLFSYTQAEAMIRHMIEGMDELRLEAGGGSLIWNHGGTLPPTKPRHSDNYIVAVRRASSGKTYTFPACHLNGYGLEYEGCICEREEDHGDGCPTSGWFGFESSDQYEGGLYTKLLDEGDELVAWAEIPKFNETTIRNLKRTP